eukprot:6391079-Prymnesium_polylepis.1
MRVPHLRGEHIERACLGLLRRVAHRRRQPRQPPLDAASHKVSERAARMHARADGCDTRHRCGRHLRVGVAHAAAEGVDKDRRAWLQAAAALEQQQPQQPHQPEAHAPAARAARDVADAREQRQQVVRRVLEPRRAPPNAERATRIAIATVAIAAAAARAGRLAIRRNGHRA